MLFLNYQSIANLLLAGNFVMDMIPALVVLQSSDWQVKVFEHIYIYTHTTRLYHRQFLDQEKWQ